MGPEFRTWGTLSIMREGPSNTTSTDLVRKRGGRGPSLSVTVIDTHFWKIMLQIFCNGYGRIYARRHRPDSIS